MENSKKFFPIIKVGGKKVVKKQGTTQTSIKEIVDKNKQLFGNSSIEELTMERNGKIFKYKNNIKIVFDDEKKPIGFLLTGFPEIKNKIITNLPMNFEKIVEDLNQETMGESDFIEEELGIE